MFGPIASKIFFHLEGSNIGKFALVCKAWSGILKIDRLWQIKFAKDFQEHSRLFETDYIECYRDLYKDLHTKGAFFTLVNDSETTSPENLINKTIVYDRISNVNINGVSTDHFPLQYTFLVVSRKRLKYESRRRMFYSKINTMTMFERAPPYTPDEICLYSKVGFANIDICAMLSTEENSYPPYSTNFYIKKVYKRSFIIEVISSTIE